MARDLSDETNENLRRRLRAYMAEENLTGSDIARAMKVSAPSVSDFLSDKSGLSYVNAEKLVQLLGATMADFGIGERAVERDDRYPNRAKAIAMRPKAPPGAVAQLRSRALAGDDLPVGDWLAKLDRYSGALSAVDSLDALERGDPLANEKPKAKRIRRA